MVWGERRPDFQPFLWYLVVAQRAQQRLVPLILGQEASRHSSGKISSPVRLRFDIRCKRSSWREQVSVKTCQVLTMRTFFADCLLHTALISL